jgi:hypothetical protein
MCQCVLGFRDWRHDSQQAQEMGSSVEQYLLKMFELTLYSSSSKQSGNLCRMNVFIERWLVGMSFGIPHVVPDE